MWWCALYNTSSLYDVCCVSELAERSSQRPGERRKGTARGLGVSERAQCCRERPIARLPPGPASLVPKALLNVAMPMLNCPYYRALYQGGAASGGAGRGKRGGGRCTLFLLGRPFAVCCMNRHVWTRRCGGVCLGDWMRAWTVLHTVGSGIQRHARGMMVDESSSPEQQLRCQRKRRLEITQPEMTKRFPLLHRLNIHIAVSNKLGLGAWGLGLGQMEYGIPWPGTRTRVLFPLQLATMEPDQTRRANRGMQKQGRWL